MSLNKTSKSIVSVSIRISIYVLLLTFLIVFAQRGYKFGVAVFTDKGVDDAPGKDVTVVVNSGDGSMEVARALESQGIIKDARVFFVQTILYSGKFKPGTYTINTSSSPDDIIEILSAGEQKTEEGN